MSDLYAKLNHVKKLVNKFGVFLDVDKNIYEDLSKKLFSVPVVWSATDDAIHPYEATVDNAEWKLRVNDFPEEEMFTLLIDNKAVMSFTGKPETWTFPSLAASQPLTW